MTSVAGTTPYSWPWDAQLEGERLALVVVGADERWRTSCHAPDAIVATVDHLTESVRAASGLICVVHHDATTPDRPSPASTDVVSAAGTSAFFGSPLDALLRRRRRDQLLVCGWGLEGPIHSTLRAANDRGYECLLVLDACAPSDPTLVAASRSTVEMSGGIFGAVGSADAVLHALSTLRSTSEDLQ